MVVAIKRNMLPLSVKKSETVDAGGRPVWSSAFRRHRASLMSCLRQAIVGVNSIKSNAKNYWNGARRAGIRCIHLRIGPTLGICGFLFRRLVMNTAITLVRAWHVWTILPV